MELLTEIAILVLAAFVGFQVISKVPNTLHTPLMSGTNAIHGIVLLGGLIAIGHADGFFSPAASSSSRSSSARSTSSAASSSPTACSSMFKRKPARRSPTTDAEDG